MNENVNGWTRAQRGRGWRRCLGAGLSGALFAAAAARPAEARPAEEREPQPWIGVRNEPGSEWAAVRFEGGPAFGRARIVVADRPAPLFALRVKLETGRWLPGNDGLVAASTCDLDLEGSVDWVLPSPVLRPGLWLIAYVMPEEGAKLVFSNVASTGTVAGGAALQRGDMVITEYMKDPAIVSDTNGEWLELFNASPHRQNVEGWVLSDDGTNAHMIYVGGTGLVLLPRQRLVLGRNADVSANGSVVLDYVTSGFTLANGADQIVLTTRRGELSDRVDYDDVLWPDTPGASAGVHPGGEDALLNDDPGIWCSQSTPIAGAGSDSGTPGNVNDVCP